MSSESSEQEQQPSFDDPSLWTSSQNKRSSVERTCTRHLGSIFAPFQVTEPQFRFLPLLGCSIVLLNDAEFFFKQIAMFRALESMYCIQYYYTSDPAIAAMGRHIPEKLCKADSIEKQVATTYGLVIFFRMLPCIFTAVPLGYLADKAGRRPVLILHKIGTMVFVVMELVVYLTYPALPIWTLYVSALGALVGANFELSLAILFASYTDVVPSGKERSKLFFWTTGMQYIGQAIFPIIAGWLINLDGDGGTPQVSLFVSLATACLGLGINVFLLPETLHKKKNGDEKTPLMREETEHLGSDPVVTGTPEGFGCRLKNTLKMSWAHFNEAISAIGGVNFSILVTSMFCSNTAIKSIDMLGIVQYPVVKLGWTFSDVTFVTSFQAIVYILNNFALLPGYTRVAIHYKLSSSVSSLYIMLMSSFILVLGSTLLGLSYTRASFVTAVAIYTLGTGLPVVMQAYISNLVDKGRLARVLSALSMFAVAGKLAATSLGPYIFKLGIDSGKEGLRGFLFFFCAALFLGSIVTVSVVALRARETEHGLEREETYFQLQDMARERTEQGIQRSEAHAI